MVTSSLASFHVPTSFPIVSHANRLHTALEQIENRALAALPQPASTEPYAREILIDTPELLVVAARWRAGAQCTLHGHSTSAGLYRVVEGAVEQESYVPSGGKFEFAVDALAAGEELYLPPGSYHQIIARADTVTLHAYSPRPDDAVSDVDAADLPLLDEARRRHSDSAPGVRRNISGTTHNAFASFDSIDELAANLAVRWHGYEDDAHRDGTYRLPYRVLEDMRSSGILAAPLPRRQGGLGATLKETAHAISHIAASAPAAALALVMPLGNAATCRIPLSAVPPEHVARLRASQQWIAQRVRRGKILAVANSEPGGGAKISQTKSTATIGRDGISRLSGRKTFATIGPDADYFLCAARVEGSDPARVDGFFVHRDAAGMEIDDAWSPFGMKSTASVGLTLNDVAADEILGFPGCLDGVNARHWSTLLFSAVFVGIGRAALREGLKYGGRSPWALGKLAEHTLAIDAASGFLEAVCDAETWPMPKKLLERAQHVKTFATQAAVNAAMQAATISGGRCYSPDHIVYRLLSDALAGPLLRPPLASAMDTIAEGLAASLESPVPR